MYLVTEEYDDGIWAGDPEGFDSETEAREWMYKHIPRPGAQYFIYRCYELADKKEYK